MNYLFFLLGNFITNNKRFYKIDRKTIFQELRDQLTYYTKGIFKGENAPFPVTKERKFNPLQRISYVSMYVYVCTFSIITGWALFFLKVIIHQVFGVSGLF